MEHQDKIINILVVDDEESIASVLHKIITQAGYACTTAGRAGDALSILESIIFDIAIIDINLPDKNGIELLKEIKGMYDTDVVIITGFSDVYSYTEIIEQGAEDFIIKPINVGEILLRILRIAKKRKLLRDLNLAKEDIQYKLELEKTVSSILSQFLKDPDLDQAIDHALESIGKMIGARKSYLVLGSDGVTFENTHEWTGNGAAPEGSALARMTRDSLPPFIEELASGTMISVTPASDPAAVSTATRAYLESRSITSIIAFPVFVGQTFSGFIGFEDFIERVTWSSEDLSLLSMTAEIIGIGLEKKYSDRRLVEALERAEESDRLKSVFVANISHELRTPMNGILGFTDVLLREETAARTREHLQAILQSGRLLSTLLNDLIDLSKIETGYVSISHGTIDLKEMLARAESYGRMLIMQYGKSIRILVDRKESVPDFITGDPLRLEQVINNLVGNAVKFTENGDITLCVSTHGDGSLLFTVQDSGIGIPRDKYDVIFEEFRQLDESLGRRYGGSGLGLAIARKLVELMGGRIWVKPREDDRPGSIFSFTIPCSTADPIVKPKAVPEALLHRTTPKTILLVEDDRVSTLLARRILEKEGYKVMSVQNGEDAILSYTMKNGKGYDLVLMDIQIPVIDGIEATMRIREYETEKGIGRTPVIALTASAMKGEKEKCIDAGFDGYLTKPIDYDTLVDGVRQYLGEMTKPGDESSVP